MESHRNAFCPPWGLSRRIHPEPPLFFFVQIHSSTSVLRRSSVESHGILSHISHICRPRRVVRIYSSVLALTDSCANPSDSPLLRLLPRLRNPRRLLPAPAATGFLPKEVNASRPQLSILIVIPSQ